MAKIAKIGLIAFAIVINVVPGVGQAISVGILGPAVAALGGTFLAASVVYTAAALATVAATLGAVTSASIPLELLRTVHSALPILPSSRRGRHATLPIRNRRKRWRFGLSTITGDCLAPFADEGYGVVTDARAGLRVGDLASFKLRGRPEIFAKRFMGASDIGQLEFHTTNPYRPWLLDADQIEWLQRIRAVSTSQSRPAHLALLFRVWRNPSDFNLALGLVGVEHTLPPATDERALLPWYEGEGWRPSVAAPITKLAH